MFASANVKDNSSPLLFTELSNHHGSTLPPVPPPHRQKPSITALNQSLGSSHHAGHSLNSTRQITPPTGSPAPVAGQSPAELQTTPPESVPLQDSWVLGSNVPLETRYHLYLTSLSMTVPFSQEVPACLCFCNTDHRLQPQTLPKYCLLCKCNEGLESLKATHTENQEV